jgi:hypothetical protein
MTNAMIMNFEAMVIDELKPLQSIIEAVEERLRMKVEDDLKDEMGLASILSRKKELQREMEDIDEQLNRVLVSDGYSRDRGYYDFQSPFGKEVEARMALANGVIGAYRDMKKMAIRKVRLAEAPSSVAALLSDLSKEVMKMMGTAQTKLNELPQPRPENGQ